MDLYGCPQCGQAAADRLTEPWHTSHTTRCELWTASCFLLGIGGSGESGRTRPYPAHSEGTSRLPRRARPQTPLTCCTDCSDKLRWGWWSCSCDRYIAAMPVSKSESADKDAPYCRSRGRVSSGSQRRGSPRTAPCCATTAILLPQCRAGSEHLQTEFGSRLCKLFREHFSRPVRRR